MPYYPTKDSMTADIIAEAQAQGIDPQTALKVARHESLNGPWQSQLYNKYGRREQSFSPWQMNIDSPGALGSQFMKDTGLKLTPENWKAINKYALSKAKTGGWSPWMGAKAAGVTGFMGINGGGGPSASAYSSPTPQGFDINNPTPPSQLTPMQMAMNGGIPSAEEQMQMAQTPMQTAMQPQEVPGLDMSTKMGFQGADAQKPDDSTWFSRNFGKDSNYDLGGAMIGAGAALSSIDNPGGAAALSSLLKQRKGDGMSDYEKAAIGLRARELANEEAAAARGVGKEATLAESRATNVIDSINEQKSLAAEIRQSPYLDRITGVNWYVPNMPGGKAEGLQAKVDLLKSRGVFQVLGDLKAQSPTGSALGQVSNYENKLMEQAFEALKQSQSKEDFQKNLDHFEQQSDKSMAKIADVYQKTYGVPLPGYMKQDSGNAPTEESPAPLSKVLKVY